MGTVKDWTGHQRILGGLLAGLLAGALIVSLVSLGLEISHDHIQQERETREAAVFAHGIAEARSRSIREGCEAQNRRNRNTLRVVRRIYAQALRSHPATRVELRQSKRVVVLIIDALDPVQNCSATVTRAQQP